MIPVGIAFLVQDSSARGVGIMFPLLEVILPLPGIFRTFSKYGGMYSKDVSSLRLVLWKLSHFSE